MAGAAGEFAGEVGACNTVHLNWTNSTPEADQARYGLRFGDKGTHTSRTMMLSELGDLFTELGAEAGRDDVIAAVVEDNMLGKETTSNRRLSLQRLSELYGLDPSIPIYRVLRRLWDADAAGRPLTALLCALARDPLLRATAGVILPMAPGSELSRSEMIHGLQVGTDGRLKESVLDKVARNAGSSWTQSGHLTGRVRKVRRRVSPTVGPAAMAFWLGNVQGLAGSDLLGSAWARVLDATQPRLVDLALSARQAGLIHAVAGGDVVEIDPRMLGSGREAAA